MRAFLSSRTSPRLWISVLIAAILVEAWVISRNLLQPGDVELAAEEAGPQKKAPASESFDKAGKGGLPDGWASWASKGSVVEVSPLKAVSAPNALAITGPSPAVARAWMVQPQPADVQASAVVMLDTLIPAHVFVRGSKLDGLVPTYYAVTAARGVEIQLIKCSGGKIDSLAKVKSTSYFSGRWAQVAVSVKGKNLRARVLRSDTNQYLNAQGIWQAGPAWALDISDAEIGGGGLVGV